MFTERVEYERLLGEFSGQQSGPNVIFLGGVHGNEPAAISALERVFTALPAYQTIFNGRMTALIGNVNALNNQLRYVDEDLNRIWSPEEMSDLEASPEFGIDNSAEQVERREIYKTLRPFLEDKTTPLYIVDLHTTSSQSAPFAVMADTIRNREFVFNFPVPVILGLEEMIEGAIIHYTCDSGARTMAFEAGHHDDPKSVDNHEAAIWIALVSAGCLKQENVPDYESYQQRLRDASSGLSPVFETRFHYQIQPDEDFHMLPGYSNFQPVRRGENLAENQWGVIRCGGKGNIFMPLYQSQGTDGYFRIRRVKLFWLHISRLLRRSGVFRVAPLLPGIKKNPANPLELVINKRVARWLVIEILHLLGYRKKRQEGDCLIVTGRKYDLADPEKFA